MVRCRFRDVSDSCIEKDCIRNSRNKHYYKGHLMSRLHKYVVSIFAKNGGDKAIHFEVTKAKMDKILFILQNEITKKKKEREKFTSISLERFFDNDEVDTNE